MSFFDKMKTKVVDVSVKTGELAKVKAEELSLKKEISNLQETIDNHMRLMGASLYETHFMGEELQDFTQTFDQVKELYDKQCELSQRLQALSTESKRCKACNALMSQEALYCNSCGAKQS